MATGGNFSRTIESGHELFYDFPCSLCEGEGKHVEAVKYCDECFVYMCDPCVRNHDKFPLHKRHRLLDKSQFTTANKSALVSFPTTHCSKHPGEFVNIYCADHDVVCCSVCKALEHSACVNTVHLPDAAKGVQTSKEYGSVKKDIKVLISDVDKVVNEKKADVSRITNQKQLVKDTITDFRNKINKYFDDLEKNSLDELDVEEKTIIRDIDKDKTHLETTRQKAEEILKQMDSFKGDNECDLFVHVKAGKLFLEDAVQALSAVSDTEEKLSILFEIDEEFEEYLMSLKALGSFSRKTSTRGQFSPVNKLNSSGQAALATHTQPVIRSQQHGNFMPLFIGKFDVRERTDTVTCGVSSICQLLNGNILITDCNNKKLKRLDQSFKLQDSVKLSNEPHTVCAAGPGQVAVSVFKDKKIQFVSVGKTLALKRAFYVGNYCQGIVLIDSELFVCCGDINDSSSGCIEKYSMAGQLQFSIAYTPRSLPSVPIRITASDDRQHLFVTSWKSEFVIMLDLAGNVVNSFSNSDMAGLNGVCSDGGGHVLVCACTSNVVVQLSPNDQKVEVLLRETDGIIRPIAVFYDKERSKLFVSCLVSNELTVYSLK